MLTEERLVVRAQLLDELSAPVRVAATSLGALDKALTELKVSGTAAAASTDAVAAASTALAEAATTASAAETEQAAAATRNAAAQEESAVATRRAGTAAAESTVSYRRLGLGLGSLGGIARSTFSTLVSGATFLGGVAVIAGIAATVKHTSAFAAEMERIHTQAGQSQDDIPRLSRQVLELSKIVPMGPEALATGLYHIASAGLPAAQQMDILKVAAQGAAMGNADMEKTTQAMIGVIASGIPGVRNATDAMAAMNAIVGSGDMKMQGLAGAISTGVLARFTDAHLSITDFGAALATLTDNVMPAQQAATRLGMSVALLEKPSGPARAQLTALGLTSTSMAQDMTKPNGLLVALQDLRSHLDSTYPATTKMKVGAADMAAALADYKDSLTSSGIAAKDQEPLLAAYKTRIQDTGAAAIQQAKAIGAMFGGGRQSAAVEVLLTQMDRFSSKYTQQAEISSQFGQDYADYAASAPAKFAQLRATLNSTLIDIGQKIMPYLGDAAGWFAVKLPQAVHAGGDLIRRYGPDILDVFRSIGDVTGNAVTLVRNLAPAIAFLLAPLLLVAPGMRLLADATGFLADHGKALQPVLVAVVGGLVALRVVEGVIAMVARLRLAWMALSYSFVATPMGMAVVALGALAAATVYLYTHSKEFHEWIDRYGIPLWHRFTDGIVSFGVGLVSIGQGLVAARTWLLAFAAAAGTAYLVINPMPAAILRLIPTLAGLRGGLAAVGGAAKGAYLAMAPLIAVAGVLEAIQLWGQFTRGQHQAEQAVKDTAAAMKGDDLSGAIKASKALNDLSAAQGAFLTKVRSRSLGASLLPWNLADEARAAGINRQVQATSTAADQSAQQIRNFDAALGTYIGNTWDRSTAASRAAQFDMGAQQKALQELIPIAQQAGVQIGDSYSTIASKLAAYNYAVSGVGKESADYASDMHKMADATVTASDKADALKRSLDRLTGGMLDVRTSTINFRNSIDGLTQSAKDNGTSLDINTSAGRLNQTQVINSRQALNDMIVSMQKHGASAADMRVALQNGTSDLANQMLKVFGNTDAVRGMIAEMKLTPNDVDTQFRALGIDEATQKVAAFNASLKNLMAVPGMTQATATTDINRDNSLAARRATGGLITGPGSGTSDSINARLSNGEYIVNARATSENLPLLHAINYGFAGGGLVQGQDKPVPGFANGGLFTYQVDPNKVGAVYGAAVQNLQASRAAAAYGGSPGGAGGAAQWAPVVLQVLAELGQSPALLAGILSLINMESGGNARAINLTDSNAKAGHPSMGLMQTIIGTFLAYAGPYRSAGVYDPHANIYAGVSYALSRYGAAMLAAGGRHSASGGYLGYDQGGWLAPGIAGLTAPMVGNFTSAREAVMPEDVMVGAIRTELGGSGGGATSTAVHIAPGAVQIDARGATAADAAYIRGEVVKALEHLRREWEERR